MENKKFFKYGFFATLFVGGALAIAVCGSRIQNHTFRASGTEHDASCQWNHYSAVQPTYTEHGSKEFWACCTHPGHFALEAPAQGEITDVGAFSGEYFENLSSEDARYVPVFDKLSIDFNDLENNSTFGGWTVVNDGVNGYIKATNSGWVNPVVTAKLFNNEMDLGNHWKYSGDIYLVGHYQGNICFVSDTFCETNEGTFTKCLYWHSDVNNGYMQIYKNSTVNVDGTQLADFGWFTQHGVGTDENIGSVVHDNWVHVEVENNNGVVSVYVNTHLMGTVNLSLTPLQDLSFSIAMGDGAAEVRFDNFEIERIR